MTDEELKHLDLLALFHYIVGGITALFSCFPFIHVAMGIAFVMGAFPEDANGGAPPPFFGWIFIIMGSTFILIGWALAICMIIAGRRLKRRCNRIFCMVVAGIECMMMPFGTVLGVFTIILLSKDAAKELFAQSQPDRQIRP